MILAKAANESTFFSVLYHHLKFWTLNFNAPYLLQKMFAHHGLPFKNIYLNVYYHPSKFVGLVAKHPVYILRQGNWLSQASNTLYYYNDYYKG